MQLGFETIGNATLLCYDGGPVLATDPWIEGTAYFGSWTLAHEIPVAQKAAIHACKYLWISHGHPDHLSPESLATLKGKQILLPDHYGGRVAQDLRAEGYDVRILKCGEWTRLSPRMRVLSIADVFQDALLLVELDGRLVMNGNDCGDHGVGPFLKRTAEAYETSYLMCLTGYGDADMINFFDEEGKRVLPPADRKDPLGPGIGGLLQAYGATYFVPFSTMHKYQRTDSQWANNYATPLTAHRDGFELAPERLLPAYVHVDFESGETFSLNPPPTSDALHEPEEFGDDWSDELDEDDRRKAREYFGACQHLQRFLGYVNLRVGGKDNVIDVNRDAFDLGITFETPRASLMTCIEYRVFDDILIGNYAKTTLHGNWGREGTAALYPDFDPFLTKYGDNGGARTAGELKAYFAEYVRRGFFVPGYGPGGAEMKASIEPYL